MKVTLYVDKIPRNKMLKNNVKNIYNNTIKNNAFTTQELTVDSIV